ncbi:MAG: hypothetical protein B7X06_00735 [Verrucomicrobia bacterium 21-51-4]|nr:MAG: hypothetical protein B7X06_00735 [Verrucomicrobia bacterium 21-51-4]
MAQSILGHNLDAIQADGTILPVPGDHMLPDEPGHAALALGEFYRATQQTMIGDFDIIDLCARTITAQTFSDAAHENGMAYATLGLLSFGPAKGRNIVWERLLEPTRARLGERLGERAQPQYTHERVFQIARSVARYSLELTQKDETSALLDGFLADIQKTSSGGFCDDAPSMGIGGAFDVYGVLSFIFIRQALQLHVDHSLRERKLPSLRTFADRYIKLLPDIVRMDGLGWCYGRGIGAYGQMYCISLILQSMRDGWIPEEQKPLYVDILRRLFHFFFATYLDQEHGYLVIRDEERTTMDRHTTRLANFDAARYLCQWARLAKSIGATMSPQPGKSKTSGRFVLFDKSNRKEQGLFIYQDAQSGMHVQIPLVGSGQTNSSDSLAFPHAPGIFDWPVGQYMPILTPELTFGQHVVVPSFYGMRCVTSLGLKNSFSFRYEQPELISKDERMVPGLGSCKVAWNFQGDKITCEYIFMVKNQVQLDRFRYMMALAAPHSTYSIGTSFTLGEQSLRAVVERDDFQAHWGETQVVSDEPQYRSYYGKIHYLQTLERTHPLVMRPGQQYRLIISFQPDIALAGE